MADSYRLRFVGRFVFAYEGAAPNPRSVTVLAIRMNYNADLDCRPHRLLLTAPRSHVKVLGTRPANLTTFGITKEPQAGAQIFVWNLDGEDISRLDDPSAGITLTDWQMMRDIRQLGPGGRGAAGRLNQTLLPTSPWSPPSSAAAAVLVSRFTFLTGGFRCAQFDDAKKVSFEPLGQGEPHLPATDPLPDVVDVDFEVDGPLYLRLQRHSDAALSTIVLSPAEAPRLGPLVVVISNLCTRESGPYDREFAAYHDVLEDPPQARARLIPYESTEKEHGADSACTGCGTLPY